MEINSFQDEVFPNLTEEGILVFSSTGHNGCGGLDLFYAEPIEEYTWANPVNFGNPFNSSKDDFGFMTMEGGNKGCFSSNRLGGKGGDDLYLWQIKEEVIELDQLTANILILDELTGIPLQESDITLVEINNNLLYTGLIEDEIIIANQLNAATLGMLGQKVAPLGTSEKGHKYQINSDRNYFLMITREGYNNVQRIVGVQHLIQYDEYAIVMNTTSDELMDVLVMEDDQQEIETITTPAIQIEEPVVASIVIDESKTKDIIAPTIEKTEAIISSPTTTPANQVDEVFTSRGVPSELIKEAPEAIAKTINTEIARSLVANNIYYEFNKYELTNSSKQAIDDIVAQLKSTPQTAITINSHTDSRGKKSFNKDLSQKRANAVRMYMLSQGIEPDRVTAIGVGESFLLNSCVDGVKCDESAHKVNRRTEFIFDQQN